nr:class I SAM-dependent methyltransferase [Kingella kingae]
MSATIPQDLLLCEQQWAQKIGTQHRAERILLTGESHRCANWQFQAACTLVQATQAPADVLAEPNSLPWREASFDRIISLHSHTSTADLAYWLQQCWQVVAPQGPLMLFGCCPHFMWHKKHPAPQNPMCRLLWTCSASPKILAGIVLPNVISIACLCCRGDTICFRGRGMNTKIALPARLLRLMVFT